MNATETRRWQWLAGLLVLGFLVWKLAPILTPFVISAGLGWLGDPLVDRLERSGRSRGVAVGIVFLIIILVLALGSFVLAPLLWHQVEILINSLPRVADWLTGSAVPWIEHRFHVSLAKYVDPVFLLEAIQAHWQEAGGIAATILDKLTSSGVVLFSIIANVTLVPVLTFYFLRDWDVLVKRVRELLPRPSLPTITRLALESNEVLGGFLRGQLSVMLALGGIYAGGLWLVGLDLGLLIGIIAGLVSFVPYLGAFFGVSAAVVASLVQHGDPMHLALVLGVFAIGQALESFILTPWLVGDRIGLHPVAVIFAIMAGGKLFGFLGVLMALPVAALTMVMLRYAHYQYTHSNLYGAEPVAADPELAGPEAEGRPVPTATEPAPRPDV